jgi:hypothetical protein
VAIFLWKRRSRSMPWLLVLEPSLAWTEAWS